jgi:hypothetical protein
VRERLESLWSVLVRVSLLFALCSFGSYGFCYVFSFAPPDYPVKEPPRIPPLLAMGIVSSVLPLLHALRLIIGARAAKHK